MRPRWPFVVALLALVVTVGPVQARQARRVLLMDAAPDSALSGELMARLEGELTAAGYVVEHVRVTHPLDAGKVLRRGVAGRAAEGGFLSKRGEARPDLLELWSLDAATGRLERIGIGGGDPARVDASVVAVRAAERFRAHASGAWRPPEPPAPAPVVVETPGGTARGTSLALEAGATAFVDLATPVMSVAPLLRLLVEHRFTLGRLSFDAGVRLSGSAFGGRLRLQSSVAAADVSQTLALVETLIAPATNGVVSPYLLAAGGVYHVGVDGRALAADRVVGRARHTISPVFGTGLGARVRFGAGWYASVEAQSLWAVEPTAVELAAAPAAVLGSPLVSTALSLGVAP